MSYKCNNRVQFLFLFPTIICKGLSTSFLSDRCADSRDSGISWNFSEISLRTSRTTQYIYISDVIEEKRHEIPFTAFESVKKVAGRKRTCLIKTRYFASNDHVVCLYGNFLSAWENTGADPSKGYANDRINALRAGFDLRFQSASSDLSTRQKTWLNRDSNSAGHGQWLLFWKNSVNLHLSFLSVMMERCDLGCWKVWFQCKQVLGAIHVSANEGVWIVIRLVTTRTLKSLKCWRTLEIGAYETSISQIKYKNNSYVNHHPVHFFDHHLISLF